MLVDMHLVYFILFANCTSPLQNAFLNHIYSNSYTAGLAVTSKVMHNKPFSALELHKGNDCK